MTLIVFKKTKLFVIIGLVMVLAMFFPTHDYYKHYASWKNLSKAKIVKKANFYIDNRAREYEACFYAVTCETGRPALNLITSLDNWDLARTKKLTWDRRFKETCPGRTANFGLELIPRTKDQKATYPSREYAVWSFYNDRFIPQKGRFHGPFHFSEVEHEPCTARHVITTKHH